MNFGQPHLHIREPHQSNAVSEQVRALAAYRHVTVRGAWFLWIEQAYWKLSLHDFDAVTGAHSYRRMQMGLARLDGQRLLQVMINPRTAATTFTFDLDGLLNVRRFGASTPGELWTLYTPMNSILTVRGDGHFWSGPQGEPEQWEPLMA
jgi:hypothetical protein